MVTNLDGHITQNMVYIPFGEVLVEERNGSWTSSYLFNAKELDEETGLYYYGARYLNPSIALWLSTDPLQGKYPGMSPYNYCAGNPVKLVDPDGRNRVKREVEGVVEIYYDRNVKSQKDLCKFHSLNSRGNKGWFSRDKYNSTMLNDGDSFEGYTFYNDHKDNVNGKVFKEGKQVVGTKPIRGVTSDNKKFNVFVGTADDCVDASTLHKNIFGSYTGGNNPKSYAGEWNYDYIPYHIDEFPSIVHDHKYDAAGVSGGLGALFSLKVLEADKELAVSNGLICTETKDLETFAKSFATYGTFSFISTYKSVIKNIQDLWK